MNSHLSLPAIYTPISRAQSTWFTNQGKWCGELEMDYIRCASRVGAQRARADCRKEFEDFNECFSRSKQFQRYCAMQEERKKQGRPFPKTPSPDSIFIIN